MKPESMVAYLATKGWIQYSAVSGKFSVWINGIHSDAEVMVPATTDASDYAVNLSIMLRELERVEGRSQIEILRDILNSGFDVVRLSAQSSGTIDGSVRIVDGVTLFQNSRDLLLSAACSTVIRKPVFHSRKPGAALNYMHSARLGQTEHGSYVITILSPVSPPTQTSDGSLLPPDPFGRRVVKNLASSVRLTTELAGRVERITNPSMALFHDSVSRGVSANLCEAIVGLFDVGEPETIHLSVSWALTHPVNDADLNKGTVLSGDIVPTLREVARLFRARDVLENYEISGPVVKLERAEGNSIGIVTINSNVDGAVKKVVVSLSGKEYEMATNAHKSCRDVKVFGDVIRQGRVLRLQNPSKFTIIDEAEDDVLL